MTALATLGVGGAVAVTFAADALLAARHRDRPGAIPFVALTVFLAAMSVAVAVDRAGNLSELQGSFAIFGPFVFAALAWLALAFEYTGRGPVMTRRRTAWLAGFGAAVLGITALGLVVPERFRPVWSILVNVFQTSLLAAAGYGAFLVARSAISYDDLPPSGSLALTTAGGGIFAAAVILALVPALPYETGMAAMQALLGGIAVVLLLTQVRYRVFETGPSAGHLARELVFDEMSAAVAITDREDNLLDLNRTAERTFDVDQPDALGEPIDLVLGVDPAAAGGRPATIETSDAPRQFAVEASVLTSRGDEPIGRAYLLRDVTERRTHEQRLDVLNRVLRHNLRNDLDAIRGFAEALERDADAVDAAELAERIRATATDLADLGTALTRAERLLGKETLDIEVVDAAALVRGIAADVGEAYPDASIAVSAPGPSVELRTDRHVLETTLDELVENACEHNDAGNPRVELTVRTDRAGSAVIEVADDGPGIPEQERAVLLEGEETPLRHGSGVGLWLVYWGVTRLGGDLEFSENDPRGSVVSLRIPDR